MPTPDIWYCSGKLSLYIYLFPGASFFVIMLHASFYKPDEEAEPFDIEMDPV